MNMNLLVSSVPFDSRQSQLNSLGPRNGPFFKIYHCYGQESIRIAGLLTITECIEDFEGFFFNLLPQQFSSIDVCLFAFGNDGQLDHNSLLPTLTQAAFQKPLYSDNLSLGSQSQPLKCSQQLVNWIRTQIMETRAECAYHYATTATAWPQLRRLLTNYA